VGEQNWISSSTVKIQNSIFYILFIALILFIIPYFESSFRNLKRYINHYIKFNTALNNSLKSLDMSHLIYEDGIKIIKKYFEQKNILSSINIDITSLKSILKDNIKANDFDALSKLLDEFQAKSYSQLKDDKDEENIKKSLKKILKRIDEYV
tara:strand:- start:301 stop:756 length:456 start_codon:yes stop_codon:yes gene_type:complete